GRVAVEMSFECISTELLSERDFRRAGAGHEVDDVQSVEQSLRKRARGDSIEERHRGPGDQPNRGRWPPRGFKRSKQVDERVLRRRGYFLNSAHEHAAACGCINNTCAIVSQRLRADRKFAG